MTDNDQEDLRCYTPPRSLEAERAVLGAIFVNPQSLHTVLGILVEDDFFLLSHRFIFTAFRELSSGLAPIDLVTVTEQLKAVSRLEEAGGATYLAELAQGVGSATNIEAHTKLIQDMAVSRSLITVCSDLIGSAAGFTPGQSMDELLNEANDRISALFLRGSNRHCTDAAALVRQAFDKLETSHEQRSFVTGVPTGYTRLDLLTTGFHPSDLIIIGARPSMGKTAFALNIAMRVAVPKEVGVLI